MDNNIKVKHVSSYGQDYYYPENEVARRLMSLLSTRGVRKAFTEKELICAKELDFVIEVVEQEKKSFEL